MVIQLLRKKRRDTYPLKRRDTTRNHNYTILVYFLRLLSFFVYRAKDFAKKG